MWVGVRGLGSLQLPCSFQLCLSFQEASYTGFKKPGGSLITRIFQVLVASMRKSHVKVPDDKTLLYETTDAESNIKGSCKLEHNKTLRCVE